MSFFKKPKKLAVIEVVFDRFDNTVNAVRKKIIRLKKDGEFHLSDFSNELLCDYLSMDIIVSGLLEYKCMDELSDRMLAASLEEILALFEFLGKRKVYSLRYESTMKFIMHKLLAREDRQDFFRKFCDAGGFHLLNIQIDVHGIMQYSQNYGEKA